MSRCCFRPVVAGVVGVGLCCAISNVGADVGAVVGAVVGANSGQNYIGGPNLQSPPSVECVAGKHETEHVVKESRSGRFKLYDITGSHRFDATNVYFDGFSDSGELVHWPVALKVAEHMVDETIDFEYVMQGSLSDRDTRDSYSITIPSGLPEAQFSLQFAKADPGGRLYMKLTDPDGAGTFYNSKYDSSESAIVKNPKPGTWEVRIATKKRSGITVDYTLNINDGNSDDDQKLTSGCWYGSVIIGAWDENAADVTWEDPYHHSGGLTVQLDNFLIEDVSIAGHGDGIRTSGNNSIIDGAYVADIHDDCVENDDLGNVLVTDSFFDGCYAGFSARDYRDEFDGSDNLFEIRDSLVRLEAQPTVYKPEKYGEGPGHGQFFKWNKNPDTAMKLSLHNTVFLASQPGRHGGISDGNGGRFNLGLEEISTLESCSNNVMVWTGASGAFPNQEALEATGCFTVVEDYSIWMAAEAAWRERHPGRPAHP